MLQREMDSTVDYGVPLVKPNEGFFQKLLKKVHVTKKIESVDGSLLRGGWLKYVVRLEMPVQIISIIFLGTILGAAYAVTMKNSDRDYTLGDVSALSQQKTTQTINLQRGIFQENTSAKSMSEMIIESEFILSLNSIIEQQSKYITSEYTKAPKDTPLSTVASDIISEYERRKIKDLEKKILGLQQKSEKFDLNNLRLKGRLALLVVKNRAL
jgi:hypothetical protein